MISFQYHEQEMNPMIREVQRDAASGYLPLFLLLVGTAGTIWWVGEGVQAGGGAELRDEQAEGERPEQQSDRDRDGGGVEGGGHGGGTVRGGRLRGVRAR